MCRQRIRVYPLCTPDQPQPPWHQTVDETVQCQQAVNRGGVQCEEFEEPELTTVKNSRCPPCLLHERQEHDAHEAWERQALEESERLAEEHARQMEQRQADLAREEEEQLQRILQESEQTAQHAPANQGFVDDEEELRKALEASMGTSGEDEQRRAARGGGDDDDDELRRAIEASMGTTQEDEQRRAECTGVRVFFVRHVKKMCCGKITKEQTDIEKDADADGIPFLEEEDYMPCDDCVRRMFAEQDAEQFGGSSSGADVPAMRTGHLPPGFSAPTFPGFQHGVSQQIPEQIDLDPTGRGKAPRYPPDSDLPGYASRMDLSSPAEPPAPTPLDSSDAPEVMHLEELTPEEEEEEMRQQRERRAQMNASLIAQGRPPLPNNAQASVSRADGPAALQDYNEREESRPATPRTVMANQPQEDAARAHLASARVNLQQLQQQRAQPQISSAGASGGLPDDEEQEGEDDDTLGDLPSNMSRMRVSSDAPSSSAFRRGGLRSSPQALAGSSSSMPRPGEIPDLPPGAPHGPDDHDWDHDWLNEESNRSERLPTFASSIDVSRGTKPVPDQETE